MFLPPTALPPPPRPPAVVVSTKVVSCECEEVKSCECRQTPPPVVKTVEQPKAPKLPAGITAWDLKDLDGVIHRDPDYFRLIETVKRRNGEITTWRASSQAQPQFQFQGSPCANGQCYRR